jgi:hypothetical protein
VGNESLTNAVSQIIEFRLNFLAAFILEPVTVAGTLGVEGYCYEDFISEYQRLLGGKRL